MSRSRLSACLTRASVALAASALAAAPALAADGKPFFSMANTDFVKFIGLILFVGILVRYGVPALLTGQLDKRAEGIRAELDEARALREEAQSLLASFERKQRDVEEQTLRIVDKARADATAAADKAKADLQASIERRMRAAEEQITAAETAAIADVRRRAIDVAVAAAGDVIAKGLSAQEAGRFIDSAISDVETRLS